MVVLQTLLGLLVIAAIFTVVCILGYITAKYIFGLDIHLIGELSFPNIMFSIMVGLLVSMALIVFGIISYEIGSNLITLIS